MLPPPVKGFLRIYKIIPRIFAFFVWAMVARFRLGYGSTVCAGCQRSGNRCIKLHTKKDRVEIGYSGFGSFLFSGDLHATISLWPVDAPSMTTSMPSPILQTVRSVALPKKGKIKNTEVVKMQKVVRVYHRQRSHHRLREQERQCVYPRIRGLRQELPCCVRS